MKFTSQTTHWISQPKEFRVYDDSVTIITEPKTDFWQRTYYGFQNDNAPALLLPMDPSYFSFIVRTDFEYQHRFDQCGIILYQDSDNWVKASIEYENDQFQRLGSVVTNNGYSDWATIDISTSQKHMYYRLSRRESDFCIEYSDDGMAFKQMRILHFFAGQATVNVGVYACSPEDSSFAAQFSEIEITDCAWQAHE